jgi:hypothetical protein
VIIQRERQIAKEQREESTEQTRDELHGCSIRFERGEKKRALIYRWGYLGGGSQSAIASVWHRPIRRHRG